MAIGGGGAAHAWGMWRAGGIASVMGNVGGTMKGSCEGSMPCACAMGKDCAMGNDCGMGSEAAK